MSSSISRCEKFAGDNPNSFRKVFVQSTIQDQQQLIDSLQILLSEKGFFHKLNLNAYKLNQVGFSHKCWKVYEEMRYYAAGIQKAQKE